MKKTLQILTVSVFIALLLISPTFAIDLDKYPRLNQAIEVTCSSEADMINKAHGGAVDTAYDIRSPDNVEDLRGMGWTISTNEGYGFHYWAVNCRTVTTPESGKYLDYHGRTPGQPVFFPLNISEFRFALHLLIGGEVTDNALSEIFGWTQKRIDTIPAPAAGQWYNSELPPIPHDPEWAMEILNSIGFSNTTAGHVGYWWNSNPDIGPVGELRTIYVMGCPEAIESTTAMSYRYQAAWNAFFGKKSDGVSNYFDFDLISWESPGYGEIVWLQRDFDIEGAGWRVGRDPDYLFDFFHSSKDGEDDYNLPGIHNDALDEKLYAIKYWMWPNGTYITELSDLIAIAWDAEEMLYYLTPYMVKYCEVATNAYSPGLRSWIESLGYGSDTGWSYNWLYWASDPSKATINHANSGPPSTLNPGVASTVYEFAILSRIYDGLYDIEPFLHKDINWAMKGYTIEPWTYGAGQPGQKVTVTLRHGIYWHDGDPVTSADIKWNYDFIVNAQFGRYSDILLTYDHTEIIDDYHFTIYIKCTGIWTVYFYFGNALIFPEKVWAPWWDNGAGAASWTPWTVKYDDWTQETGHGDLTCLIGTGAWVFHDWDVAAGATLVANRAGAVWAGNPGYFAGSFLREDLNFDGIVDIFDAVLLAGAAGATPGHPRWNYGQADITADYIVDIFDAVRLAGHAGWLTLPV
jgi:hypothetical protein